MSSTVFLVEDHPLYRNGLIQCIEGDPGLKVCGWADDVAGALDRIETARPDLLVLDLQLKESNGLDLLWDLRRRWPAIKVVVLSMYTELRFAERVLQAGASGYVTKDQSGQVILKAIHTALRGGVYASPVAHAQVLRQDRHTHPMDQLSDRELQIFQLVGEGHRVADIAAMLQRSEKTIQNHLDHIRAKLHIASRQELYQRAREWTLLPNR